MSLIVLLLAVVFGLPVLGFAMYWTAELMGLRVEAHKRRLSSAEAGALNAKVAELQAQVEELRAGEARIDHLEEKLAFMERLLGERTPARALGPDDSHGTERPVPPRPPGGS